jgi:hypothetical protein
MIRTRMLTAISSLVAILACSSLAGTEPNDANTPLVFENSSVELPSPSLQRVPGVKSTWKGMVTYAAGVPLNFSKYFVYPGRTGEVRSLISFAMKRGISSDQRRFLETTWGGFDEDTSRVRERLDPPDWYVPPEDPNSPQVLLYAVSLDDAEKMAEAYVQYAQDRFRDTIAPIQREIELYTKMLTDFQQKQPEAIQAAEAAGRAFQELAKQVPYRDDKQALEAAAELDKMLNAAQVDIAGIQAALRAIQDQMKSSSGNASLKSKLEAMFAEESIALQAAEARKGMATTLRKQADSYIDLKDAMQTAEREKDHVAHVIATVPEAIRQARERLADEIDKEPKVIGNKVFIYSVRPPDKPRSITGDS